MHHSDLESYFPAWASRIHFLSVPLWRWGSIPPRLDPHIDRSESPHQSSDLVTSRPSSSKERISLDTKNAIIAAQVTYFFPDHGIHGSSGPVGMPLTALGRHYWQGVDSLILIRISIAWAGNFRFTDMLVSFTRHRCSDTKCRWSALPSSALIGRGLQNSCRARTDHRPAYPCRCEMFSALVAGLGIWRCRPGSRSPGKRLADPVWRRHVGSSCAALFALATSVRSTETWEP